MATDIKKVVSLHDLLDYEARKFTSAEIHLKNNLQKWVGVAGDFKLKAVLQKYTDMVTVHVQKFENFFAEEGISSISLNNLVMNAFVKETNDQVGACADTEVKDACLLSCIQAINHFKISMYGTAAAFAQKLGMENQAAVFHESMADEKKIDERLSQLAEHVVNIKAASPLAIKG
ncbi:MAG: DUF892 family protein [Ferruginibacter sp.]